MLKNTKDLAPKTSLISKNITIMGRRTSIRLEPEMWDSLREIAEREHCSMHDICTLVAVRKSPETSLTAGIRVFLMLYFRSAATQEGHSRAGHGSFEYMKQRARVSNEALSGGHCTTAPVYGQMSQQGAMAG